MVRVQQGTSSFSPLHPDVCGEQALPSVSEEFNLTRATGRHHQERVMHVSFNKHSSTCLKQVHEHKYTTIIILHEHKWCRRLGRPKIKLKLNPNLMDVGWGARRVCLVLVLRLCRLRPCPLLVPCFAIGAAPGVFLRMQLNTQDFDKTLEFPHKSGKNLANTWGFWQNEYTGWKWIPSTSSLAQPLFALQAVEHGGRRQKTLPAALSQRFSPQPRNLLPEEEYRLLAGERLIMAMSPDLAELPLGSLQDPEVVLAVLLLQPWVLVVIGAVLRVGLRLRLRLRLRWWWRLRADFEAKPTEPRFPMARHFWGGEERMERKRWWKWEDSTAGLDGVVGTLCWW